MRERVVRRIALGLTAALVAAAALFPFAVSRRAAAQEDDGAPRPGVLVFERSCSGCHAPSDLAQELAGSPDRARTVLEWLELLDDHGAATPREDRAVLVFLLGAPR